jgi:hypothetical protein
MPVSPISKLPKDQRQELLDDLDYLSISEIKSYCKRQSIPYNSVHNCNRNQRWIQKKDKRG